MRNRKIIHSLVGALLISAGARAQATEPVGPQKPVIVENTAQNPVPTTVQGAITGSVAVTNTPTVNVSSLPPVSISGTPQVSIAGTPTVLVANQPGAPPNLGTPYRELLVPDTDKPATSSVVAAGKRRTINAIAANWHCVPGHKATALVLLDKTLSSIYLPAQLAAAFPGAFDKYVALVGSLGIVLEPGETATAFIFPENPATGPCSANIFLLGTELEGN